MVGWEKQSQGEFNETWKPQKKGQSLEGKFLGTKDITTQFGAQVVHTILTEKGEFDIFGCGKLNYLLTPIKEGDKIKLVYLGKIDATIKVGKRNLQKKIHDFELYLWK